MHGAVYAWSCICMELYMHGSVYAWSHIRMEPYMHGAIYAWSCICMERYTCSASSLSLLPACSPCSLSIPGSLELSWGLWKPPAHSPCFQLAPSHSQWPLVCYSMFLGPHHLCGARGKLEARGVRGSKRGGRGSEGREREQEGSERSEGSKRDWEEVRGSHQWTA